VGLLDRAENLSKSSDATKPSQGSVPKSKSLLEKAKQFLKEESDEDWIGDISDLPATEISDDLPIPDAEVEVDLSELGGYSPEGEEDFGFSEPTLDSDDLIDFNEETPENAESEEISSFDSEEDDFKNQEPDLDLDLTAEEPLLDDNFSLPEPDLEEPSLIDDVAEESEINPNEQNLSDEDELENNLEIPEDISVENKDENVVPAELPEVDLFDDWEKDAHAESVKQPIRPINEDPVPQDKSFLFDDESDFSTAPMGQYIASKKRIENYQAVFEITKEISASKDFAEFFDNLVFSIIGQVGCSSVVVVTSTLQEAERWDALNAEGIDLMDTWSFESNDEVFQRIKETDTVIYAGELKQRNVPDREKQILDEMEAEILVPIRHKESCYGFLALGRLINEEEYIVDDLEFVKVIGDIAGSVFERVSEFEKLTEELVNVKQVVEINESVLKSARDFAGVRKMDDAYDLLIDNLKKKLGVKQFSLLVLDSENRSDYIVFGSNFILPERAKDFRLSKDSDIVGMVSNVAGVYKLENFREDSELKSIFTNDELGIMSEFTILPIINLNWLVGMVVVHATVSPWTDMSRDIAVAIMETSAPVLANLLILSEKEALFRNPFNPLETKILSEIEKAEKMKLNFTVSIFKIQNVARMIHLFGAGKFARYADTLRKTITDHISENDFFTRVGQGKFAIVLHGKDREETEIVIKKIKSSFGKREEFFSATFKPSYRILSLSYPNDTKDKNQFMEMIEEA